MGTNDATREKATERLGEALDEHRECMRVVAELEGCLDRPPDSPQAWLGTVRDCLLRLRHSLTEHFGEEGESWLYREVPLRRPRFAPALERLEGEHPDILKALDEVLEKTRIGAKAERHHLRELNGFVQLFTAKLRRHEAEENEILVAAALEDTGSAG